MKAESSLLNGKAEFRKNERVKSMIPVSEKDE
jgi:hypothetical protein